MAIFNNNDQQKSVDPKAKAKGATVIASGTEFKGDITLSSSSLHIDGNVEGIIYSDNAIIIGSKGKVDGDVTANKLVINGTFNGTAESEVVEILSRGHVKGKLVYSELTIEKGASFEGETSRREVQLKDKEGNKTKKIPANKIELLPNGSAKKA